jgi:hypothetical protein
MPARRAWQSPDQDVEETSLQILIDGSQTSMAQVRPMLALASRVASSVVR